MTGLQNGSSPLRADYDYRAFARALMHKRQRDHADQGIRALAGEIGVTVSDLSRAMGGQMVSVGKVIALCKWLGVPVEEFYLPPDFSLETTCFTGTNVKRERGEARP
ncbi:helix-turn-helix transcriptional regulator [Rhizobium sp. LC145]|uniref:helix-turn-helix domain-containing protein n=1 Tax=Rhizobium sp. LC145 TaxID=1120688 RepID=UPI00062A2445|nr:helix-turn-helix transcriptional regulator [Rhizobium sp. LC145]KKX28244.1 hypothetical protein YH62_19340 [Rhizobium sp. LC145]TKT58338.1 helix-turn-helix transcriptional regulator [Rhizobiaceae bacterium LC148]